MPYSVPTPPSGAATPIAPPVHTRSLSSEPSYHSYSFTSERGPGAFASLGSLPRRGGAGPSLGGHPRATTANAKRFHIKPSSEHSSSSSSSDDDDDEQEYFTLRRNLSNPEKKRDNDDADDDATHPSLPPLKIRINRVDSPSFNGVGGIPFPRSSPLSSPMPGPSSPLPSPTRTASGLLSPISGLNSPTNDLTGLPDASETQPISSSNPIYSPYTNSSKDGTPQVLPLRPSPTRTSSSPQIVLANGRPLKSSLKSSSSATNLPSHVHDHAHHAHHSRHFHSVHQRARSAPSTPGVDLLADPDTPSPAISPALSSPADSGASSPTTPKSVHFPSLPIHLERVRVFHRSAKPASLFVTRGQGEETETETETDRGSGSGWGYGYSSWAGTGTGTRTSKGADSFPFPKLGKSPLAANSSVPTSPSALSSATEKASGLVLDMEGYPIPDPATIPPSFGTNILLESLSLSSHTATEKLQVLGSFIVRNIAFQKDVAVRFTLDEWSTVSEIRANWASSIPSPFAVHQRSSLQHTEETWDRFSFAINLSDYTFASLPSKVIYFVGRYTVPGGEYWDNCSGRNWRIGFKVVKVEENDEVKLKEVDAVVSSATVSAKVSAPVASAVPSAATPTATTSSPVLSPVVAPPSPRRAEALVTATAQRLRRFSLSNYVSPSSSVASAAAAAAKPEVESSTITRKEEKPASSVSSREAQSEEESAEPDAGVDTKVLSAEPAVGSPSSSPRGSTSTAPLPPSVLPRAAPSPPSSAPSSSSSSPKPSSAPSAPAEANSESLYDWFVQQWCFGGMSSSNASGHGNQLRRGNELGFGEGIGRGLGLEIEG